MTTKRRPTTTEHDDATVPLTHPTTPSASLPSVERIQQEVATAPRMDDFCGKEGIFARLFATTLAQMLEAELTAHLGDERDATAGHTSGNRRTGNRPRKLRSSGGARTMQVPRDRKSTFQSPLLEPYQTSTTEREDKLMALSAKGSSPRAMQETLRDGYGVAVSPATSRTVTDKGWAVVEAWQNRPLATIYPLI